MAHFENWRWTNEACRNRLIHVNSKHMYGEAIIAMNGRKGGNGISNSQLCNGKPS